MRRSIRMFAWAVAIRVITPWVPDARTVLIFLFIFGWLLLLVWSLF
jgi:hypothetical protein